jgi:hypothetical protein
MNQYANGDGESRIHELMELSSMARKNNGGAIALLGKFRLYLVETWCRQADTGDKGPSSVSHSSANRRISGLSEGTRDPNTAQQHPRCRRKFAHGYLSPTLLALISTEDGPKTERCYVFCSGAYLTKQCVVSMKTTDKRTRKTERPVFHKRAASRLSI